MDRASCRAAWDASAARVAAGSKLEAAAVDGQRAPQARRVASLEARLKALKKEDKSEDSVAATRLLLDDLEQAHKELHLPVRAGWVVRMAHGGALLGMKDFFVEKISAALKLSVVPGRLSSGARQAALIRVTCDASGGGADGGHGVLLRCDRLRLTKLSGSSFSLIPGQLEVGHLQLALRCVAHLTFAFGSDGRWVGTQPSKLEVVSLRAEVGGGTRMSDLVTRWLLERMLPNVLQRAVLRRCACRTLPGRTPRTQHRAAFARLHARIALCGSLVTCLPRVPQLHLDPPRDILSARAGCPSSSAGT